MSANDGGSPAAAANANAGGDDWRASVAQSYRNLEVRQIAQVLASLEPGATSTSKLRLAMQFEDSVFKSADSLADYRKRLSKRLKKVQKSYVAPTQQVVHTQREKTLLELKAKYGATIQYILKHASKAVQEMKVKYGEDKANKLRLHTDGVKLWATDLGLLENTQLNVKMSDEHFEKLKLHLERNAEIIRSHVVKAAEPDQFLLENLEKTEGDISVKASRFLAADTLKRYQYVQRHPVLMGSTSASVGTTNSNSPTPALADASAASTATASTAVSLFQDSITRALSSVPLPTRNQRNDEQTAVLQLDKLRAAATAVMAYMMLEDKSIVPRGTLSKIQQVANEGIPFVESVVKEHRKNTVASQLSLQDVWLKQIEIPHDTEGNGQGESNDKSGLSADLPIDMSGSASNSKSPPPTAPAIAIRSRVLLTPGRKTPSNLLPELKRQRAILVRPPPDGQGSHLVLPFRPICIVTIYMVPLVVTIRAWSASCEREISDFVMRHSTPVSCAPWRGIHEGLVAEEEDENEYGYDYRYGKASDETLPIASSAATLKPASAPVKSGEKSSDEIKLSVWGVTGTYDTLGPLVKERLRDASAQATHALRQSFGRTVKETSGDFETEIREASALLEYIKIVRRTFVPEWQEDNS
jgi:KIX domain